MLSRMLFPMALPILPVAGARRVRERRTLRAKWLGRCHPQNECICMCIYIYIYVCVRVCMCQKNMRLFLKLFVDLVVYLSISKYIHMYICIYVHMYTCKYQCMYVHVCILYIYATPPRPTFFVLGMSLAALSFFSSSHLLQHCIRKVACAHAPGHISPTYVAVA